MSARREVSAASRAGGEGGEGGMLQALLNQGNICETTPKCVPGGDMTFGCDFPAQPGKASPGTQLLPLLLFFPRQTVRR